jgi:hypothetical protein
MSQASIERIIGKAMLDTGFRNALLANPEQTLSGFSLTEHEKNYIKRMDAETLDQLAGLLAERTRQWQLGIIPETYSNPA